MSAVATVDKKLTARQKVFVDHFVDTLSPYQSAIAAGIAESRANVQAHKWRDVTQCPHVVAAIEEGLKKRRERFKQESLRIVHELMKIATFNPKSLLDRNGSIMALKDLPDDVAACIQSMEVSVKDVMQGNQVTNSRIRSINVKFWDKLGALSQLAKHLGYFYEQQNLARQLPEDQADGTGKEGGGMKLDWDRLFSPSDTAAIKQQDSIEARLLALEAPSAPANAIPVTELLDTGLKPTTLNDVQVNGVYHDPDSEED